MMNPPRKTPSVLIACLVFSTAALSLLVSCGTGGGTTESPFTYTRPAAGPLTFYFDSAAGSNDNDGLSESAPFRDLWVIDYLSPRAGDRFLLKCGAVWTGDRIRLTGTGTAGEPIQVSFWGAGDPPGILNTRPEEPAVYLSGSHINVEGLLISGTDRAPGIQTAAGSSFITVSDCEITGTGIGVTFRGSDHLLEDCSIHNLEMIRNTPGGDDDYGAIGVFIEGSRITVRGNTFMDCRAVSEDYGTDGGTIEIWRNCSDITIEYNRSEDNNGFMEIGGQSGDTVSGILIHHNLSVNDIAVFVAHFSGSFGTAVSGIEYENNTIVVTDNNQGYSLFEAGAVTLPAGTLSVRNNIFLTTGAGAGRVFHMNTDSVIARGGNLYSRPASDLWIGLPGFVPASSELAGTDPLLTDVAGGDFRLQSGSPAIDQGESLGYTRDIEGNPVPRAGTDPDSGAWEPAGP